MKRFLILLMLASVTTGGGIAGQDPQLDEIPKLVKRVDPVYPELARKTGIEGKVLVQVTLDTTGRVTDVKVQKSDHEVLNEAAVQAARQWVFAPARKGGRNIGIVLTLPFAFKLADRKEGETTEERQGEKDAVAAGLTGKVQAILKGDVGKNPAALVTPGALLLEGGTSLDLLDALKGRSKSTLFTEGFDRTTSMIRSKSSDQGNLIIVIARTESRTTSRTWWHTVMWVKGTDGSYRIQHWHASR